MFMDETAKDAVAGSRLMTRLTALLLLEEIRYSGEEGQLAEQANEGGETEAEAETAGISTKITNDVWRYSNQYETLQGSLSKITNERDQPIGCKNDLQCKLAEQAKKMVKLEYKVRKKLTSGARG